MNLRYRKKPIIIEAFQMTLERRWDNQDWPKWLHMAWNKEPDEPGALYCVRLETDPPGVKSGLKINTLEGVHTVMPGDYIIQGIQGELYPCKPDIFHQTYEPVDD